MTQHDALLAAVCAAPDDDLPRLVYADWCEENGQPERAEFIRVQCEFDRHPERDAALALAEDVRRREHGIPPDRRYAAELYLRSLRLMPRCPYWNQCEELVWVRGFIDRVVCHSYVWLGGVCVVCSGAGTVSDPIRSPGVRQDCLQCGGRGRFDPGIGPAVVREHPVRRVEIADVIRQPIEFAGTSFAYLPGNTIRASDILPLCKFLKAPAVSTVGVFRFASQDDATTALSEAAIAWAKSVSG